jgi:hypothetical protein
MHIIIEKDPATRIPKECTEEQAAEFANDFAVFVVAEDGSLAPFVAAADEAAPAPVATTFPALSPDQQDAADEGDE